MTKITRQHLHIPLYNRPSQICKHTPPTRTALRGTRARARSKRFVVTLDEARERASDLLTFCRENHHLVSTEMADVVESIGERLQGVVVTARMKERNIASYFKKLD